MYRTFSFVTVILLLAILISCSGTAKTTNQSPEQEDKNYPSWYSQEAFTSDENMVYAYATAISEDSATAVSKAVKRAKTELKASLSNKLENIRADAVTELGSNSGLDTPRFLIALRKADNAVDPLVSTGITEVEKVENYNSYRAFAEVSVPKGQLIDRIGKRLGGYEKAWNALRGSKAFNNF